MKYSTNNMLALIQKTVAIGLMMLCINEGLLAEETGLGRFNEGEREIIRRMLEVSESRPEESRLRVRQIRDYNAGRTQELDLVEKVLIPNSGFTSQLFPIRMLRLDDRTTPLFIDLLEYDGDPRIRAAVVARYRIEARRNRKIPREVVNLLEGYVGDVYENPHLQNMSRLTLVDISPTQIVDFPEESVENQSAPSSPPPVDIPPDGIDAHEPGGPVRETEEAAGDSKSVPGQKPHSDNAQRAWLFVLLALLVVSLIIALYRFRKKTDSSPENKSGHP